MPTITNHTRQALALPKKGGGLIEVPAGGSTPGELDKDSPKVKGHLHAGTITTGRGETPAPVPPEPEPETKKRAAKPD